MTGGYSNMTKKKIKDLIAKMTLEEKAAMCSGADFWHTESCERLGIPASMVSDGPHGLRKQDDKADHLGVNESIKAVCFPAGCGTAASFNRDLLYHMGETLGNECQAEGVSVILGPAVNIKRSPLCQELQKTLSLLKFKCWYYETAMKDGNEDAINAMLPDKLPENIQKLYNEGHK